jgi:hypothetical protein
MVMFKSYDKLPEGSMISQMISQYFSLLRIAFLGCHDSWPLAARN